MLKKKDDMNNNYSPVSILFIFSKYFETIVAQQLRLHFENIFLRFYLLTFCFNNLLCAYRKKCACENVLVKLIDSWKYALDNDKFVDTLLFFFFFVHIQLLYYNICLSSHSCASYLIYSS